MKSSSQTWVLKTVIICLLVYGLVSSFALWNRVTDEQSIMLKEANILCPDNSKLSERQANTIKALQEENEKLLLDSEELLKKLHRQEQKTKDARFDLTTLRRSMVASNPQQQNSSSIPKAKTSLLRYEPLNLIEQNHLHLSDYEADCWMLNRKNFFNLNPPPEIAGTQTGARPSMFHDWMDFSVEHLSHLWKVLNVINVPDPTIFQTAIQHYERYLEIASRSVSLYKSYSDIHNHQGEEAMSQAIAMISFQPMSASAHGREMFQERADLLTVYSLAATIASLYQVGFGRILVVGFRVDDIIGVEAAFRLVDSSFNQDGAQSGNSTISNERLSWNTSLLMKGGTELAYARIRDADLVFTRHIKVSMVRGCIVGMQKALGGKLNADQTKEWLGDKKNATDYWKYVYLSEPDTILHTKPWLLPSIRHALDKGHSFYPHRIQPLPHAYNFGTSHKASPDKFLPSTVSPFSNITTLDPLYKHQDSCCDGGDVLPGRTLEYGTGRFPCDGYWWWACGFFHNETSKMTEREVLNRHVRLLEYPMVRLKDGSGLVWGSNERGRRCFPSKTACPTS